MTDPMTTPDLTEAEMIEILKALARNGGDSAAISAIRLLREIGHGQAPVAGLYEVSNPGRIRAKSTGA
jgi:hypothetical protein